MDIEQDSNMETVCYLTDPALCRQWLAEIEGPPLFTCTLASTDTAEIPNISAAGATPEKRRYTAALDAEILLHGVPLSLPEIPKNPAGPPSPVVITRAALELLDCAPLIIDAGCRVAPRTPRLDLGGTPGRCITKGHALQLTPEWIDNCRYAGCWLAGQCRWLVLAESVPGGTTTAQALLQALDIPAQGRVSSSMPGGNHQLKREVVGQALQAAGLRRPGSALAWAQALGDPMQPAVALMALEASLRVPVLLGGGTQMAAVVALAQRLHQEGYPGRPERIALATTRWVAEDPSADLRALLRDLPFSLPAFSAELDFSDSQLTGLRQYEQGMVKEGVGAGAAAFSALTAGIEHARLMTHIEAVTRRFCEDGAPEVPHTGRWPRGESLSA